jgi:hypothetical protein
VSIDITSETVTLSGGTITLEGTGDPGQVLDIFINGSATPVGNTTVDPNGDWTFGPITPPVGARSITVRVVVRGSTSQKERTEVITITPGAIIAMLNKEVKQKGAKTRRVKATHITVHRAKPKPKK